jgi:hypothetical protein
MASSKARAIFDYAEEDPQSKSLQFNKGDIITIIQKDDSGWWKGELNGKMGWLPSNFVEEISDQYDNQEYYDQSGYNEPASPNSPTSPGSDYYDEKGYNQAMSYFQQTENNYSKDYDPYAQYDQQQYGDQNNDPYSYDQQYYDPNNQYTEPPPPAYEDPETQAKKREERFKILQEIISTEKKFVWDLGIIKSVFLTPIKASGLLSQSDIDLIFGNIEVIVRVNTEQLQKLQERFGIKYKSDDHMIGEVFLFMIPYLQTYKDYCNHYDSAIKRLTKLMKSNKALNKFLQEASRRPMCHKRRIEDFLIMPIQRICKYPLLLRVRLITFGFFMVILLLYIL